jgi:hypothetical protein
MHDHLLEPGGDLASTQRGVERVARADDADAGAEHHVVAELDPADVVKPAALVHEDVPADAEVQAAVAVHRRDLVKGRVDGLAGELAPSRCDALAVVVGERVQPLGAADGK